MVMGENLEVIKVWVIFLRLPEYRQALRVLKAWFAASSRRDECLWREINQSSFCGKRETVCCIHQRRMDGATVVLERVTDTTLSEDAAIASAGAGGLWTTIFTGL